jgi:sulfatase modifying factor 1
MGRVAVLGFVLAACGETPVPGVDLSLGVDGGAEDGSPRDLAVEVGPCPSEMALVSLGDGGVCVDRWEAFVVEITDGGERVHSLFSVVDGIAVRARSASGVMPQGYISQVQAAQACANAGKRLCGAGEFAAACRGDAAADYPYGGTQRLVGACNEGKGSSVARFFGSDATQWTYANFNDPKLNQWDGGLAPTGSYPRCESPAGVFDCVGNLHEWGSDAADAKGHGRFRGGFYGDAEINGRGCRYVTSAHELSYHDYSTGFRCCADPN